MKHPTLATLLTLLAVTASPVAAAPADALRADIQTRVENFQQQALSAKVHWRADLLAPSMLLGLQAQTEGATAESKAQSWVAANASLFGLNATDLTLASSSRFHGRTSVTFQQVHEGTTVHQRTMVVVIDAQGLIQRVVNNTLPVMTLKRATGVDARAIAAARFGEQAQVGVASKHKRVIVATPVGAYEAAIVQVAPSAERLDVVEVVVDLSAGKVASLRPTLKR